MQGKQREVGQNTFYYDYEQSKIIYRQQLTGGPTVNTVGEKSRGKLFITDVRIVLNSLTTAIRVSCCYAENKLVWTAPKCPLGHWG